MKAAGITFIDQKKKKKEVKALSARAPKRNNVSCHKICGQYQYQIIYNTWQLDFKTPTVACPKSQLCLDKRLETKKQNKKAQQQKRQTPKHQENSLDAWYMCRCWICR